MGDTDKQAANTPLWSLLGLVIFVVSMVIVYITDHADDAGLLLALAASSIPSLVASLSAERAARDIRNGTVTQKAKEGTKQAIEETGVMTRTGPVAVANTAALAAQTAALSTLLQDIHTLTEANTTKLEQVAVAVEESRTNGVPG